ncbi:MAG: TM2 domain-containing protein [Planctomycetes bacterium]|nr:TM2 domain-containing protein [Planctomycetota bacterium]
MATISFPNAQGSTAPEDLIEIDLKEPWIAAILAWALPGLGHIYQGRTGKGILFFVCILGTFFYGLYMGNSKEVYAAVPWEQQYRWQYLCQLGVGLPSTPMLWQRSKVLKDPDFEGFMAPPRRGQFETKDDSGNISRQPSERAKWTLDTHPFSEISTVYTVVAGLLNILVICDAAAGPLLISTQPDKKKKKDDSDDDSP